LLFGTNPGRQFAKPYLEKTPPHKKRLDGVAPPHYLKKRKKPIYMYIYIRSLGTSGSCL
jgi:hypothetical protein